MVMNGGVDTMCKFSICDILAIRSCCCVALGQGFLTWGASSPRGR